jgi:hypothetical protein
LGVDSNVRWLTPLCASFDKPDMARDGREMIIGQERGESSGKKGAQAQRGIGTA